MLGWSVWFIIIALIAGILGFGLVAGTTAVVAKATFGVFSLLTVGTYIAGRRALTA